MRRGAKEDDRLFLRQWRRIPLRKREKGARHAVYTRLSARARKNRRAAR